MRLNQAKSTITPIRCEEINLVEVLHNFVGQITIFPIKYLGMPISLSRIRLIHLQFILDRIRARLAGCKGTMMSITGRRVLVRCVLTAIPTFALSVVQVPKKFFRGMDKVGRRFLWAQHKEITGDSSR